MNPVNQNHIPIPLLREMFAKSLEDESPHKISVNLAAIDFALHTVSSNFKLLHHLLISRYSKVTLHHTNTMFGMVGLDIETDHTTGKPKLLGYSYEDGYYFSVENPTLVDLFGTVNSLINNKRGTNLVTWGNLDITCIIRLFDPNEDERNRIKSGLGGNFSKGEWIAEPPLLREVNGTPFFIDHYISGRSLRLGVIHKNRSYSIWIYNISQFYPTTIAETAKALGFDWTNYDRDTHLVDWNRFTADPDYRVLVIESNRQDAEIVRKMATNLANTFNNVFGAYPKLLVSAGSLADGAVSKLLSVDDYASNNWRHLRYTTFKGSPFIDLAESILSEAYSAGYVDQFGIGYYERAFTADISSAYPDKIRRLPDLRNFRIFAGKGDPSLKISELEDSGWRVFTAAIRGTVTIPEHLKFHPITVKTAQRQNIRPLGTFNAAYMLEERTFCIEWGARFTSEVWTLFATKEWKTAPIARVSEKLQELRSDFIRKRQNAATDEEAMLFDGMQYTVKVVDNSLYGKNVMTVSIVEDIDGKPTTTGFRAGDRFNQLYGAWITATTRIQLAEACMALDKAGSRPIMAMTDAVYWSGNKDDLPFESIAKVKTAGYFESPETIDDFYVVKTGQYEYRKGHVFDHKVRGLNMPYEDRSSKESFYRKTIKEWAAEKLTWHPEDIEIPIRTRKLMTIGMHDLNKLGLIEDGISMMRPFVLSGKQVEPWITDWVKCLDGHIWLKPAVIELDEDDTPLQFISGLHEKGGNYLNRHERKRLFYLLAVKCTGKVILDKRLSHYSWVELEEWAGLKREWCKI